MKTALRIAKNGYPEDRKANEQAQAEKLPSERIRALQTARKTTPHEKSWGCKMAQAKSMKKSHSEERKEPYIRESNHTK